MSSAIVQLTRQGFSSCGDVEAIASALSSDHVVRLPQLIDEQLLARIQSRVAAATWTRMDHPGVGSDLLIDDPSTVGLLHFLASDPEFLRFVTRVAGCPPITHFNGRVYRLVADPDVHDSWHDDLRDDTRHVALSINLGAEPYTGGLFRLRRRANEEVIAEMPNVRAGDALLFRLSPKLQHMVTPMTGGTTKTAFAGWFQSDGSSLLQSIKDRSEREHDHAAHSQ